MFLGSFVFGNLLPRPRHRDLATYVFLTFDSCPAVNSQKVIKNYVYVFEEIFLPNYEIEFFHQAFNPYIYTLWRLMNGKKWNLVFAFESW